MEFFLAMVLAVGFAGLLSKIGAPPGDRGVGAIAQFLGGWRPDPWPRGVQEEDRDGPWGAAASAAIVGAAKLPDPRPMLSRVRPTIGHR